MMEIYSFDTINDYHVVVEPLNDGSFEALIYKIDPRNPDDWKSFKDPETARNWGLMLAKKGGQHDEYKP